MPEKNNNQAVSASRMTFRAWFYRTDPQNSGGQFGTVSGFLRNFSKANEPKKAPKYVSDRKVSGLFLRNKHQFIPWRLRFLAWLNLYIIPR